MFNLQGSELVIILLLALVVLGPEKLPDAMRKMGQFYAELKKMSSGFQQEFRSVVDEPLREVRDTANMLRDSADFTKLQEGERDEKPKSAEMAAVADTPSTPVDEVPTFEGGSAEPDAAADDGEVGDTPGESRADPFASSEGFSAAPAVRESGPATDDVEVGDTPGESRADPFASSEGFSAAPAVRESGPATDGDESGSDAAGTGGAEPDTAETATAATPAMKPFPSLTPFAGVSAPSTDADQTGDTGDTAGANDQGDPEVDERVAGEPSDRGSAE